MATGQWARILEQDLKQKQITTVGQLAGMDVKTVGELRGVKPPKVQTVKLALTSYHNKVKKEETSFRKGTPVQEETSQEEEDRIKAEFFSRPSPSPTDLASDQENVTEEEEEEKQVEEPCKQPTEDNIGEESKEESTEDKIDGETSNELTVEKLDNEPLKVVTEVAAEAQTEKESQSHEEREIKENEIVTDEESSSEEIVKETDDISDSTKIVPETESIEEGEPKANDDPIPSKPTIVDAVLCEATENQEMETEVNEESEDEIVAPGVPEEPVEVSNCDNVDVSDVVTALSITDLDLTKCSNDKLNQLFKNICDHSRKVETLKENVAHTLFSRLNQTQK